jgi:hypothetical protein
MSEGFKAPPTTVIEMDRIQILMAVHYELVKAAGLPKSSRPYGVQTRVGDIEKLMMEEIEKIANPVHTYTSPTKTNDDDNIPF